MIQNTFFFQSLSYTFFFFNSWVITACAVLRNIFLGAGDIMLQEDGEQDGMDEEESGLEGLSVCRCLPWRRVTRITIIFVVGNQHNKGIISQSVL